MTTLQRPLAAALLGLVALSAQAAFQYQVLLPGVAAIAPTCALPWGGTIALNDEVLAYPAASVPFGESCVSEVRSCIKGVLTGSNTSPSCTVAAPTFDTTFDAANKAGTVTLYANNLQAYSWVGNYGFTGYVGEPSNPYAFSTRGRTTGKWYFELTLSGNGYMRGGVANLAGAVNSKPAVGPVQSGGFYGFAVDLDARRIDWYNSACTLVSSMAIPGGSTYHAFFEGGGGGQTVTANFGGSTFRCTPPAGHTAGF